MSLIASYAPISVVGAGRECGAGVAGVTGVVGVVGVVGVTGAFGGLGAFGVLVSPPTAVVLASESINTAPASAMVNSELCCFIAFSRCCLIDRAAALRFCHCLIVVAHLFDIDLQ